MNDDNKTDFSVADLSDVTLEIKPDNINDICNVWESSIKEADLNSIDVRTIYKPLIDNEVGVSYFECLHNSFEAVNNLIFSTSSTIKQSLEQQVDVGNSYSNYYGSENNYGNNYGYNGNSNSNSNNNTNVGVNGNNNTNVDIPVDNVSNDKIKINQEFIDKINSLDANSYITFMTALASISKDNLLELIAKESNASLLKKALLESPNLNADLKKIISKMDENEVQVTLQSILIDKVNLSDTSKQIIYKYTESLGNSTNLDILKVTKEEQFYKNVDELLEKTSELANKENVKEELLKIYDGECENENTINFARIIVDEIAKKNDTSYEELLTNDTYSGKIKEELNNLSKSLAYFKTVNKFGTEAAGLIYKTALS